MRICRGKGAIALYALILSCASDQAPTTPLPLPSDASSPDGAIGEGDAAPEMLTHCLERPNDLPAPPKGGLGCDLIPPGLRLP